MKKIIGAIVLPPAALGFGALMAEFGGWYGMAFILFALCVAMSVGLYALWRI